jgi:hypothetical protein
MIHYWVTAIVLVVLYICFMLLEALLFFTKDRVTVYFEANGQCIIAGKFSELPRPGDNGPCLT